MITVRTINTDVEGLPFRDNVEAAERKRKGERPSEGFEKGRKIYLQEERETSLYGIRGTFSRQIYWPSLITKTQYLL